MEKKLRIYIVAENEEQENIFKAFKKKCIDINLNHKQALIKLLDDFAKQI